MSRVPLCLAMAACVALFACGDDDDDDGTGGSTATGGNGGSGAATTTSSTGGSGGEAVSCTPTTLCERSINECDADITQTVCENFYASNDQCTDIASYTTCNCVCFEAASCAEYFSCGEDCFSDHCN